MVQAPAFLADLVSSASEEGLDLNFCLPDPECPEVSEAEFQQQIESAWQVCDRFDLQTDIWRGRILRSIRDREKRLEGMGMGFMHWLREREITKSQAYHLIELADSADTLLKQGYLEEDAIECFSKRAFVETAKASPEVQQLVCDMAQRGDSPRITRREVRQLSDEWAAMTSDLIPEAVKEKAAANSIPMRYVAPLVREMEKLPEAHQMQIREAVAENPDVDTLKQATAEARYLSKYLTAATQVQAIDPDSMNLELALEEALRIGCLNATADLVNQAAQVEQAIGKLYTSWRRINQLSDRLYVDTGASTPHL
ncbi:MAG: hypothetical protein SFW36_11590, partial [Leptolyngbyaceae cyanobacterium bins.59]|nr:hypothetical protein [Leptolyngbyaceae cyanobacterium bins.59]